MTQYGASPHTISSYRDTFRLLLTNVHLHNGTVPTHFFFFFQAEDGIRDFHVTGVQTCALPICRACSCCWTATSTTPPSWARSPPPRRICWCGSRPTASCRCWPATPTGP